MSRINTGMFVSEFFPDVLVAALDTENTPDSEALLIEARQSTANAVNILRETQSFIGALGAIGHYLPEYGQTAPLIVATYRDLDLREFATNLLEAAYGYLEQLLRQSGQNDWGISLYDLHNIRSAVDVAFIALILSGTWLNEKEGESVALWVKYTNLLDFRHKLHEKYIAVLGAVLLRLWKGHNYAAGFRLWLRSINMLDSEEDGRYREVLTRMAMSDCDGKIPGFWETITKVIPITRLLPG